MIFFVVTTCLLNDCPIRNPIHRRHRVETLVKPQPLPKVSRSWRKKHISRIASHPNSTLNILYTENNRLVAEDKATENCGTCTTVSTTTLSPTTFVVDGGRYVLPTASS
jgi:hypothetical protein